MLLKLFIFFVYKIIMHPDCKLVMIIFQYYLEQPLTSHHSTSSIFLKLYSYLGHDCIHCVLPRSTKQPLKVFLIKVHLRFSDCLVIIIFIIIMCRLLQRRLTIMDIVFHLNNSHRGYYLWWVPEPALTPRCKPYAGL